MTGGRSEQQTKHPVGPVAPDRAGDLLFRGLATVVRGIYSAAISKEITGHENLPGSGGYIVVANHITEIDPVTVAYPVYTHGTIPRFLAKDSLFRVPVLGYFLTKTAQIPVSRGSMDAKKSLDSARAVIKAGGAVLIYPEGTLTRDPDLWPMAGRTGAARLALATGAPVLPLAHWGDQELLPPRARRPHLFPRKKARVRIGRPIDFSDLVSPEGGRPSREALEQATERMMGAVTSLLEDLRGQKAPAGRWDPRRNERVRQD